MGNEVCDSCRKRVLTDISANAIKMPRKVGAADLSLDTSSKVELAPAAAIPALVPDSQVEAPNTPPRAGELAAAVEAEPEPASQARQLSEQQSAHLLLKACEREEAAEDRAATAEAALKAAKKRAREAEERALAAEQALEAAQERIKLLELQCVQQAINGGRQCDGSQSDQAASEDGSAATEEMLEAAEEWSQRAASTDGDAADVADDSLQLRLELEETQARLQLSKQAEQEAKSYADAAAERLDAFAAMLRGCSTIAFAGNDTSARRTRHHLFRCLDVDCDGFLGGSDLQHWYRASEKFLDTQGYDPVSFEAIQAQLADALYNPTLPEEFRCRGKVSLMALSRSKLGAGVVATLLNLDNMMQERSTAEWDANRAIALS